MDISSHKNNQSAPYKKGDFIGQKYEVFGVLGKGGFGVVYLVYCHPTYSIYALKTFCDEYISDYKIRERFRKEANIWIDLEHHPYLVHAHVVDEVDKRLYIALEYIAPNEQGLNTLEGYLEYYPPDLGQSLRWAIQFCHGMEYAYSKGIKTHRDIKPANIMITQDKRVKITDFGLAGVLDPSRELSETKIVIKNGKIGLSSLTKDGVGFGTLTHMPPEQWTNATMCDERSDIYAFGVVLYQMATGGKLPFLPPYPKDNSKNEIMRFEMEMQRLHCESSLPKVNSPLSPMIQCCLEKEPSMRYQNIKELRKELESLLYRKTGEHVNQPTIKELEAWEWSNKGYSLSTLGRLEEAVCCHDKAIEIDPSFALAWNNKGSNLHKIGRFEEAIDCFDRAIKIDSGYTDSWSNKGVSLSKLGRYEEAINCFDKALELEIRCIGAWHNKGNTLDEIGRFEEALHCYAKTIELDCEFTHAWLGKGTVLSKMKRFNEAIQCFDKVIELDPNLFTAWYNKGIDLRDLGRFEEALNCVDKAIEIDPSKFDAWGAKASVLTLLGRLEESLDYLDKVAELNPADPLLWFIKATLELQLGRKKDAIHSFREVIALSPGQNTKEVYEARNYLRELEGK